RGQRILRSHGARAVERAHGATPAAPDDRGSGRNRRYGRRACERADDGHGRGCGRGARQTRGCKGVETTGADHMTGFAPRTRVTGVALAVIVLTGIVLRVRGLA